LGGTSRSGWRRRVARALCAAAALAIGCAMPAGESVEWRAPLGRDDPRVGQIYDAAKGAVVPRDELLARAKLADFVLLGEKHDNPDHHQLQAHLIQALARDDRRPAVAFEMLSDDDRPKLELWQQTDPKSVSAFGDILDWKHSGWPDFALYRPIFEVALARELPIEPANLSKGQLVALHGGLAALPEARRRALGLDAPLSPAARESLADEIREGHCGMANDALVATMVDVQRARDAMLADALLRAGPPAVLIAGAGHVRRDRGVPLYLARRAPERRVLAIAFVEVGRDGGPDLHDLVSAFDYVWWTPRVDDEDPCTRFKDELEKMRHPAPGGA
jgi:uncharacterized iron-regulated protein